MWKLNRLIFLVFVFFVLSSLCIVCSPPNSASPVSDNTSTKPLPAPIPTTPVTPQQPEEPQKTPASPLEKGWRIYSDKDEGYEIALPAMWQVLTKEQIAQVTEKAGLTLSGGTRYIFYGIDMYATTLAIAGGKSKVLEFGGSLSILKTSFSAKISLDEIEEQNVRSFANKTDVVQPIFHKQVEVLSGKAVKIRYTIKLPNRTENVVFIHYYLIKDNNMYCFTFETLPSLLEKLELNYDKMAGSFRFTQ